MAKKIACEYMNSFRDFILSSETLEIGLEKAKYCAKMEVLFHNTL